MAFIKFGTGGDFTIHHNGSNTKLVENSGNAFQIQSDDVRLQSTAGESYFIGTANGAANLYHNNVKQLSTRSDGIEIHAPEGGEAGLYLTADEGDDDNDKYRIVAQNGGDLVFQRFKTSVTAYASELRLKSAGGIQANFDGSNKLETTSSGVTVSSDASTGSILKGVARFTPNNSTTVKVMWDEGGFSGAGHFQVKDGVSFTAGDSSDLKIFHDGTDDVIHSTGTSLRTRSNIFRVNNAANTAVMFRAFSSGAFEAYHNGNKKFETLDDGVNVTGTLKVNNSAASFGKILQVVHTKITNAFTYNSTVMNNVGISASITPSATSSKILVMFNINAGSNNNGNRIVFRVSRTGDDNEFVGDASGSRTRGSAQMAVSNPQDMRGVHISYVSSPSSTSAVTYALQAKLQVGGGSYVVFGASGTDSNNSIEGRTPQHITLMEIAG